MINKALGQGEARKMQDATQAWEKKTHIYIYTHKFCLNQVCRKL